MCIRDSNETGAAQAAPVSLLREFLVYRHARSLQQWGKDLRNFRCGSDRVDLVLVAPHTFDKLQVIVLRKVENEAVRHGLDLVKPTIYENRFFSLVLAGTDIWRVFHLLFGTKCREDATQSFRPVAWAETSAITGYSCLLYTSRCV